MALDINFPDKILAGLNQSYTITSDEGPPGGSVQLEGKDLPHRIIPLGPPKDAKESTTPIMKYKVSFWLPDGSSGMKLTLRFQAGASKVDESRPVTGS